MVLMIASAAAAAREDRAPVGAPARNTMSAPPSAVPQPRPKRPSLRSTSTNFHRPELPPLAAPLAAIQGVSLSVATRISKCYSASELIDIEEAELASLPLVTASSAKKPRRLGPVLARRVKNVFC